MVKEWKSPDIVTRAFYHDMANQTHLLIGGTTGSGKSNLLNGFIYSLLRFFPDEVQFVLIDPKRTELKKYRSLPHTLEYANDAESIRKAIKVAKDIMLKRQAELDADDFATMYEGSDIWVVIDEYAVLPDMIGNKAIKDLESIACLGRALRVHIIFCTQRPVAKVVTGMIKANVSATVALKTASPQESRNLIEVRGCETLPKYGKAYYRTSTYAGELIDLDIPYTDPDELKRVIDFWIAQK